MQSCTVTLEDTLGSFYRAKHRLMIQCSSCTTRYLPNLSWKFFHTKTCMWIFLCLHLKCPKLEATKMCITRWMDKQTAESPNNGMLCSVIKRNELLGYEPRHRKSWMHVAKWKNPVWKDQMLYDLTIWHSGKDKTMETIKLSVVARNLDGKVGWMNNKRLTGSLGHWTILYDTIMMDTRFYAFLITHTTIQHEE